MLLYYKKIGISLIILIIWIIYNELLYNIVVSLRDDERNHVLFNVLNSKKIMIRK